MNAFIFIAAALAEIVGCYAFWAWIRLGKSPLWLIPGVAALMIFAYLLTIPESRFTLIDGMWSAHQYVLLAQR